MSDKVLVELTNEERWALDAIAVMAIEHRQIPEHWQGKERALATASAKLRNAQPVELSKSESKYLIDLITVGAYWLLPSSDEPVLVVEGTMLADATREAGVLHLLTKEAQDLHEVLRFALERLTE